MNIKIFTFNQFFENTFIISDSTNECIIIDPGCYDKNEKQILQDYILSNNLVPTRLINTHCHIDHILGNNFVSKTWDLELEIHHKDIDLLKNSKNIADLYGFVNYENSPITNKFLVEGDIIATGTPSGVGIGFDPPKFLKSGDKVKISIDPIGILENDVI